MMTTRAKRKPTMPTAVQVRRERRALFAVALLLAAMLGLVAACGDDDLIFPGEFVATPTSNADNTPTPTPEDGEDEDDEFDEL